VSCECAIFKDFLFSLSSLDDFLLVFSFFWLLSVLVCIFFRPLVTGFSGRLTFRTLNLFPPPCPSTIFPNSLCELVLSLWRRAFFPLLALFCSRYPSPPILGSFFSCHVFFPPFSPSGPTPPFSRSVTLRTPLNTGFQIVS